MQILWTPLLHGMEIKDTHTDLLWDTKKSADDMKFWTTLGNNIFSLTICIIFPITLHDCWPYQDLFYTFTKIIHFCFAVFLLGLAQSYVSFISKGNFIFCTRFWSNFSIKCYWNIWPNVYLVLCNISFI